MNQFGDTLSGGDGSGGSQTIKFIPINGANAWSTLGTASWGVYRLSITSPTSGGPCASFELSRSDPNAAYNQGPFFASPGSDGTKLGVRWPSNDSIQLAKDTVAYDGSYRIVIVG